VPEVYLTEGSSPLTAKVDAQSKELKIELVSSAGARPTSVTGGIPGATDPQSMLKAMQSQASPATK